MTMSRAVEWRRDGGNWPNRTASRFVEAAGLSWHVQVAGQGPDLLLLHGTGAATHSWAGLLPLLAQHGRVIAPDLPGHGFTASPPPYRLSLPGMAMAIAELLRVLDAHPVLAVGHSAGGAIAARLALDGRIAPRALIGINPALLPLGGLPGQVFSPIAKFLAGVPAVPALFAWRAGDRRLVERLLRDTGSRLDAASVEHYASLVRRPSHVAAALGMMAHWDLRPLQRELPGLAVPLTLVIGDQDRTVLPREARRVLALLPAARRVTLPDLGHLAHEERPDLVAALVLEHLLEHRTPAAVPA